MCDEDVTRGVDCALNLRIICRLAQRVRVASRQTNGSFSQMLVANREQTFSLISFAISASTYRMSRRPKQPRQGQREKSILDIEVLSRKCVSYEVQKIF